MKEIKTILALYDTIDFQRRKAALATVIRVEGSAYRRVGARMLVLDDGVWTGGISGGCLEGDALKRARLAIHQNKSSTVVYDTTRDDEYQIGVGLGCNGVIETLFTPIDPADPYNPISLFRKLTQQRTVHIVVAVIETRGAVPFQAGQFFDLITLKRLAEANRLEALRNRLEKDVQQLSARKRSSIVEYQLPGGSVKLLLETILPPVRLVLAGANYDVFPLARCACELGWEIVLVAAARKFSAALSGVADRLVEPAEPLPVDDFTAVVLLAHDYSTDLENLKKSLAARAPYIGVLGPKKRWLKMTQTLETQPDLMEESGLFAPVGLDIGANTPEEIAMSIIAEIIAFFSGRAGGFLRDRAEPIHSDE